MPLRFTFRQLEYLVAVGEAGTIAAAAERLNVSSPSISAAIAQLEAEFALPLFVRHHARGLSLTPGGRRLFNEARQILDRAAALPDLASDIMERPRGPIAVGVLTSIAPLLSASVRHSFQAAYPEARVALREGHQVDLLRMLGRAEIDVAITYDLEIPKDIAFEALLPLPPQVMLAPDHPLAARERLHLSDLAGLPMVLLDMPLSRDYFLSMFQAADLRPAIAERTADMGVARGLVAHGFGFALVNTRPPNPAAMDGAPLVLRPLAGDHRPMILGLASKRAERRARILAAFHDHLAVRVTRGDLPGMGPAPAP
jgi:DNA-binding transcriptional LysR family regulator